MKNVSKKLMMRELEDRRKDFVIKKSFLFGKIFHLSFLANFKRIITLFIFLLLLFNFSSANNSNESIFSIEGLNLNNENILNNGGGTNGNNNGNNGGGDGNIFHYSEKAQLDQQSKAEYLSGLSKKIDNLTSGGYENVDSVDLDGNGKEEILATKNNNLYILEWNGTTYKQSSFYGKNHYGIVEAAATTNGRANSRKNMFLRLEDGNGESKYYLMQGKDGSKYYGSRAGSSNGKTTERIDENGDKQSCSANENAGYSDIYCKLELYKKGKQIGKNIQDDLKSQSSCHVKEFIECLYAGDGENYGYRNGKFFMTNNDGIKNYYDLVSSDKSLGGYQLYRYKPTIDNTGLNENSTEPFQSGNIIVKSEYDRFLKKANADGTYNYKITLAHPNGKQVVAFYGLDYHGITFKDLNGDGVKDIITYANYKSEDNVIFKRIYIFLFNESTYKYDKVLDGIDSLEYKLYDIESDGDLDILIKRYDEKLYLYKNNNVGSNFGFVGAIRGTYYLFDTFINNGKMQIITKNISNNGLTGEWKIYNIGGEGFFDSTGNYERGIIGKSYKKLDVDSNTHKLFGIMKDSNKYKIVYYNKKNGLFENFPIEFFVEDLSNDILINSITGTLAFKNTNGEYVSFYKDNESGSYINTEVYFLENGITVRATNDAVSGQEYGLLSNKYYIAGDKSSIQSKINSGYIAGNIVTTKVSDFGGIFENNTTFNSDINSWDTSNVISMNSMFKGATSFNKTIQNWNCSKVNDIRNMFDGATSFNQNLSSLNFFKGIKEHSWSGFDNGAGNWNSSNKPKLYTVLTKLNGVTRYLTDTSIEDGEYTINGVKYYVVSTKDQIKNYIGGDDISKSEFIITTKVNDMSSLFYSGRDMNRYQDSSKCRSCQRREPDCRDRNTPKNRSRNSSGRTRVWLRDGEATKNLTFNGNISTWDTSNVTTMENMFKQNHCFNQDLSHWDTSNVTNMNNMFSNQTGISSIFKGNISSWNVEKVGSNHTGFRCNTCQQPKWKS